jgi:hypothetical protein
MQGAQECDKRSANTSVRDTSGELLFLALFISLNELQVQNRSPMGNTQLQHDCKGRGLPGVVGYHTHLSQILESFWKVQL